METQPTTGNKPPVRDYLADRVKFHYGKLAAIHAKILNFQPASPDDEEYLLWLFRADEMWDDGKFDAEIEAYRCPPPPKKTYNTKKKREAAGAAKTNGTLKRRTTASRFKKSKT